VVRGPRGEAILETPVAVQRLQPPDYRIFLDSKALSWKSVESSSNKAKRFGFGPRCDANWQQALLLAWDRCWESSSASAVQKPTMEEYNTVVAEISSQMDQLPERPFKYAKC
jgi:hypothetical protein